MELFVAALVAQFLSSADKWKFKDLCNTARKYILSHDHEAQCLLECLRLTFGFWSPGTSVYASMRRKYNLNVQTWLQLLIILEDEMKSHGFRAPNEIDVNGIWKRVSDHDLERLNYTVKFFDPSWISWDDHGRLHGDIAMYALKDSPGDSSEAKDVESRVVPRYGRERSLTATYTLEKCLDEWLVQAFDDADIMLKWIQYPSAYSHSLDQWQDGFSGHSQNGMASPSSTSSTASTATQGTPQSLAKSRLEHRRQLADYFLTPFIIRVLLLNSQLVLRLIDVEDSLTPCRFLDEVHHAQLASDEPVVLWGVPIQEALELNRGVWYIDYDNFWPESVAALRACGPLPSENKSGRRRIHPLDNSRDLLSFSALKECVGALEQHTLRAIGKATLRLIKELHTNEEEDTVMELSYRMGLVKYIEGRLKVLMIHPHKVCHINRPQMTPFSRGIEESIR